MTQPALGEFVSGATVRRAVRDTLTEWFPSTLAEVLRRHGVEPDRYRPVAAWEVLPDVSNWDADVFPAGAVTSTGLINRPQRTADGAYKATWEVFVSMMCRGDTYLEVADLVGMYALAARLCCVQHPDHGGLATGTAWLGEGYDRLDSNASRTIGGGVVNLAVTVPLAMDDLAGLTTVPEDPLAELPTLGTAQTVSVDFDQE